MRRIQVFFINTLILIVSSFFLKALTTVFGIYISNLIGSEALGVFQLIMSVYMFGITLATSGLNLACTRIVSEEIVKNNPDKAKKAAKKCTFISLCIGMLSSFFLLINSKLIVRVFLHNKVSENIVWAMCIALPFISMTASINGYFTAVKRVYKNALCQFGEQISKIIATAYLLHFFLPKGLDYICLSLIIGDVISEIASFIFSYIFYVFDAKKYNFTDRNAENYTFKILRISVPVAITSYIRSGLSTLKQVIIPNSLEKNGLSCSSALSKYGIVSGMVLPIIVFPSILVSSFSELLIPEFSRYIAKKDYKRIRDVTTYSIVITSILSIILTLFLILFAKPINKLFYSNYEITAYIKLMSPLILFIYIDIVVDNILKALDAQVSVMIINVIDLVITVSFIFFFVPVLGTKGYILSLYISELLNFSLSSYKLIKILKSSNT